MNTKMIERLPTLAAVALVVLVFAACAIRPRDDEGQSSTPASTDVKSDPLAMKLAECCSVTYEQKDALSECRKAWAEKRRQFLGAESASAVRYWGCSGGWLLVVRCAEGREPLAIWFPSDSAVREGVTNGRYWNH